MTRERFLSPDDKYTTQYHATRLLPQENIAHAAATAKAATVTLGDVARRTLALGMDCSRDAEGIPECPVLL